MVETLPVDEVAVPDPPIDPHAVSSERLFDHADAMIREADRLQSSEKVCGAVAHAVKEMARTRDWPLDSHQDFGTIVDYVAEQAGESRIAPLFLSVQSLHRNFYDDNVSLDYIRRRLEDAKELLPLLRAAHEALPPDLPAPSDAVYRQNQRITLNALESGLDMDAARALKYHVQNHRRAERDAARRERRPSPKPRALTVSVRGRHVRVDAKGGVSLAHP